MAAWGTRIDDSPMPRLSTTTVRDGSSATLVVTREDEAEPLLVVACARLRGREVKVTIRTVPPLPSLEPGEAWGIDEHQNLLDAFRGALRTYETNVANFDALPGVFLPAIAPEEWDQIERELGKVTV